MDERSLSPKQEADYGQTVLSSLFLHIFGDVLQERKEKKPMSVSLNEIKKTLTEDPSSVCSAVQTPLFQSVLSDLTFVRKLLFSNSIIQNMMVVNPGLRAYIEDDYRLQDFISVLSDPQNYTDFAQLKTLILHKLETGIGSKLNCVRCTLVE